MLMVVPKAGLEPARGFPHCPLKTACLPVPPLRLKYYSPPKFNIASSSGVISVGDAGGLLSAALFIIDVDSC